MTLAETSANSLTLNDHLLLCTGTNYATPNVNNMLGFGQTGSITADTITDSPNITSGVLFNYGTVTLPVGVWLLYGTAGFQVTVPVSSTGTITSVQVSIGGSGTLSGNFGMRDDSTLTVSYLASGRYISHQVMRIQSITTASTAQTLNAKYTFTGCTLNSRVGYSSLYAYRIA